ncbi:general stress protein [Azospirillum argentinense]
MASKDNGQDEVQSGSGRTSNRGFASMDRDRQRQIASKGGESVPADKRSFSKNPELAAEAGRKGGRSVPASSRSFSKNPSLAAEAGRKGGQASHGGRGAALRPGGGD